MKVTNLILNLLNAINLYLWGFMPMFIGFFASFIEAIFTGKADGDLIFAGFVGSFGCLLATAYIPLSIIAFNKARRGRKKPYVIIESILLSLSAIVFILAIPAITDFRDFIDTAKDSSWTYLTAFPVIGLFITLNSVILTILIGVIKGRPAAPAPQTTATQYQPYQEFRQPYLNAMPQLNQQAQQIPQTQRQELPPQP